MSGRRKARVAALQLLFQKDLVSDVTTEVTEDLLVELLPQSDQREFAWQLYAGTLDHRLKIDKEIQRVAQNWRVNRMSVTDRNVIRMGVFEMEMMRTEPAVVINECIEIAKEFGLPQSGPFVNGILDKLKPQPEPEVAPVIPLAIPAAPIEKLDSKEIESEVSQLGVIAAEVAATEPSDYEHSNDEHSNDEHSDDQHSDDEHSDDEHSDDEHSDDEHSDDEHSDDEHFDDEDWDDDDDEDWDEEDWDDLEEDG